jgi:hypothetical protein
MLKFAGLVCIAAGVAGFWFGGVPYTTKDTVLQLGPLKAEADVRHRLEVPAQVSAGAIGLGTVLLLIPRRKGGSRS